MRVLLLIAQLWTSASTGNPNAIIEGTWQSCRDANGYGERVYTYCKNPAMLECHGADVAWEFHMGPYHDFAMFAFDTEDMEDNHDSSAQLLVPHVAEMKDQRAVLEVSTKKLGLHVSAHLAGGSRDDCETFVVKVERLRR